MHTKQIVFSQNKCQSKYIFIIFYFLSQNLDPGLIIIDNPIYFIELCFNSYYFIQHRMNNNIFIVRKLFLGFFILLLNGLASGLLLPPTWMSNTMVQTDRKKVINGDLCNCKTGSNANPLPSATFTFIQAFAVIPNLGYGLSDYQGTDTLISQKFEITRTGLTVSTFSVKIQIFGITNIWTMQVRYVAVSKAFPHHLNSFDNVPVNYNNGGLVNVTTSSPQLKTYLNTVNYTLHAISVGSIYQTFSLPLTNNKILLFMTSLYIDGTFDISGTAVPLKLATKATPITTTSYTFFVQFGYKAVLSKLHFSIISFDQNDVQSSGLYLLVYQQVTFPMTGGFYSFPQQFAFSFMIGLKEYTTNKTAVVVHFSLNFGVYNGTYGVYMPPSVSRNNSYLPANNYTLTIFYLKSWLCSNNTFLNNSINMCQDCKLIGCINCTSLTSCLFCNNTQGYFLNLTSKTCFLCSIPGCLNCTSATICAQCDLLSNYILVNQSCQLCNVTNNFFANALTNTCVKCSLLGCLTCSNLTSCSQCNTSQAYYLVNQTCSFCDPLTNNFINSTTLFCEPCTIPNCVNCSSLLSCLNCDTSLNYHLNPNDSLCYVCTIPHCVTCYSLTVCTLCNETEGYIVNNTTGSCDLCPPGLLPNTTSNICQACPISNCLVCSTLSSCASCNVNNSYYLQGLTCSFCDSSQNFFINISTLSCQACNLANCINCSSLLTCSQCDSSLNYLLNDTDDLCYPCLIPNCASCQSFSNCSLCNELTGYVLNITTGQCDSCPSGLLPNISSLICQICTIPYCLSCETLTRCLVCETNNSYYLVNDTCSYCDSSIGYFLNYTTLTCHRCQILQCLVCSTLSSCASCNVNNSYYLQGLTCSFCDSSQNFFINISTLSCQACNLANCINCSSLLTCSQCDSSLNYLLNDTDDLCYPCLIPNCASCQSFSNCSLCNELTGYVLNITTGQCDSCPSGLLPNISSLICQICTIPYCLSCETLTRCLVCEKNNSYYLVNDTCQFCDPLTNNFINSTTLFCEPCTIPNCVNCSSLLSCLNCDTSLNYHLNPNDSLCYVCTIPHCVTCYSLTVCTLCNETEGYIVNNTTGSCDLCPPGLLPNTTSNICQACPISNCLVCSTLSSCASCNVNNSYYLQGLTCSFCDSSQNFFINISTLSCQACNLANCINCSSLLTCSQCDSSLNYLLNDTDDLCYPCLIPNCASCQSFSNCSLCNELTGYVLNITTGQCDSCPSGLLPNISSLICQICTIPYCLSCETLTRCLVCETNNSYYLVNDTCSYCDSSIGYFLNYTTLTCHRCQILQCLVCSTLSSCASCNVNNSYYLQGLTCSFCDSSQNFFINISTLSCQACNLANCINCSSLLTCSQCDSSLNYLLNDTDDLCYPCLIPNCASCQSFSNCSLCNELTGYVLNITTGQCDSCPSGLLPNISSLICQICTIPYCLSCETLTRCLVCEKNNSYYLVNDTCQFCDPLTNNFINSTTLFCEPCTIPNCVNCSSLLSCLNCDTSLNYHLNPNDSLCYVCTIPHCVTCYSLTVCTLCNETEGYIVNNTTGSCDLCPPGLLPNTTSNICQACPISNCLVCSTLSSCASCNVNNSYYLQGLTCSFCDSSQNFFINISTLSCQACNLANCINCSSLLTCSQCDSSLNYLLNDTDDLCYPCLIPNCASCQSFSNCSLCNELIGYIVNQTTGFCQLCDFGTFANTSTHVCQPCLILNCQICPLGYICNSCNLNNLYYLVNDTCQFCDPLTNNFINSTTLFCEPCTIPNCVNCSSLLSCLNCDTSLNYHLNPNDSLCYVCTIPHCVTCYSLAVCTLCNETEGYIVNNTTGSCDLCPPGLLPNTTSNICQACPISNCLVCSTLSSCASCNFSQNYYVQNDSCSYCDPLLNFFINFDSSGCQPCAVQNCLNCSSLYVCQACDISVNYLLYTDGYCYLCTLPFCLTCQTFDKCSVCDASQGYFYNQTSQLCQQCNVFACLQCKSLYQCLVCNQSSNYGIDLTRTNESVCGGCNVSCVCDGYILPWNPILQICSAQCGDGLLRLDQQCDDNNTDPGDGCSPLCKVQKYFVCDTNEPTVCNSTLFIQAEIVSMQKQGCNSFKIYLKIIPELEIQQVKSTVGILNEKITITGIKKSSTLIEMKLDYFRDIANQTIKIQFDPGMLISFYYQPDTPALYYNSEQCKVTQNVEIYLKTIEIASYIVLLFSLLSCKIVGLQLFGVLQLSYFTLSMQDFFVLYLAPLAKFRTFNGLNIQFTKQQTPLPTNFTRLSVASSFINNCNIMLILLFGQLIVSIVLYIIAKTTNRDKLRKVALRMLKQGFITLVIFNIFNISYSAGVHWKYASAADDGYILSSIILYGTLIAAIVATFAMCITDADDYGEFKNKFKHVWICRAYIPLTILYRAILGFYTAVQSDYSQGTLLIIAFSMAFMMYNIVNFPFYDTLQNYRATFVHITMLYTLLATNYYAGMKMNTPYELKGRQYAAGVTELALILLCLVMSMITLSYQIYRIIRNCKRKQEIQNERQDRNNTEQSLQVFQRQQ